MRVYKIVYAVFIASIFFDLATSILCFQIGGVAETNLLYRIVGVWAFPIVYFINAVTIITVEWMRKYLPWSPLILLIPTLAYLRAGLINMELILLVGKAATTRLTS